jgi:hypothetical protein
MYSASGHKRNSNSHSITQGSFAHPCVYLAAAGGKPAGFDSGLQTGGQFSINITNDQQRKPNIFVFLLYCRYHRRLLTKRCDSHLVLLQTRQTLRPGNGRVRGFFRAFDSPSGVSFNQERFRLSPGRSMHAPKEKPMTRTWPLQRPSARTKILCVDDSLGPLGFQCAYLPS